VCEFASLQAEAQAAQVTLHETEEEYVQVLAAEEMQRERVVELNALYAERHKGERMLDVDGVWRLSMEGGPEESLLERSFTTLKESIATPFRGPPLQHGHAFEEGDEVRRLQY